MKTSIKEIFNQNPDLLNDYQNFTILGKRGFGKSYFTKYLLEQLSKSKKQAILITDINDEYSFRKGKTFVFYDLESFENHFDNEGLEPGSFYVFKSRNLEEYYELFEIVNESEDILLVLEEANITSTAYYLHPALKELVALGRHNNLNYIAIARRPTEINNDLMSQSNFIVTTRQVIDNDLKTLQKFSSGFEFDNLRNLEIGEYFIIRV